MPVYSGLIPPDAGLLSRVEAADVAMFFLTWSSSLLTNPMFAIDFPMDNCKEDCRSVIMPGGLTIARQAKPFLNESVYFGDVFTDIDTITIHNATGMVLKYETTPPSVFDIASDCIYTGEQVRNGLQVCVRQIDSSILVGRSGQPLTPETATNCELQDGLRVQSQSTTLGSAVPTPPGDWSP